jgi:ABC-type molybdate transport system ATPase subunit
VEILSRNSETAIPIAEEEVREVLKIADRVYVLRNGRVLTSSAAELHGGTDATSSREAPPKEHKGADDPVVKHATIDVSLRHCGINEPDLWMVDGIPQPVREIACSKKQWCEPKAEES